MSEVMYPLIGIPLIFVCTTLGALFVLFIKSKDISPRLNKIFIGFASGVMLSASFFSLIKPALESETKNIPTWLIVSISIILGALFLWGIDKIVPHLHIGDKEEGMHANKLSKTGKMFLAVTIHNVPEGLSVGIAFGVALSQANNGSIVTSNWYWYSKHTRRSSSITTNKIRNRII